ncbi:MAG: fused MFS/spermidine synthase [Candidatus Altiarchaeota archaeon]
MKKSLWYSIFSIGFSSILAQIMILREALAGFYGNELILGIVLGNWLLLTGIGTYAGRKTQTLKGKTNLFSFTQIIIPFLAAAMIYSIRAFRAYFFTPGEMVGLIQAIFFSFLMLMPFCILSGVQYTLASAISSGKRRNKAYELSNVYVADTLGHLTSGFLAGFVLIPYFTSFQMVYLIALLSISSALLLAADAGDRKLIGLSMAALIAFSAPALSGADFEAAVTQLQYPGQNLVRVQESVYGRIVVTETDGQLNFYENSFPLFSTGDTHAREDIVHYAMLEHPEPDRVLLISGGVSGTIKEVLKYDPYLVDYVELDPGVIDVGRRYTNNLDDDRVNIYNVDGREFVRHAGGRYDVVLVDLPDPASLQVNRFYTLEFFREVKNLLSEGGILSVSLTGSENYVSGEARQLNAAVYQSLAQVFGNVLIIPDSTNHYVASDARLDYNYKEKLGEKNIKTDYFEYYLPGVITEDRIHSINEALTVKTRLNTDFAPASHLYYFRYWMSMFEVDYRLVLALGFAALAFALYVSRIKPVPLTILATGFTAMTLELVLIVSFQILYGYVYHKIGLIVAAFMLGDVAGAYAANTFVKGKKITARFLSKLDFAMAGYCIILPAIILWAGGGHTRLFAEAGIPILTFIIGALVGLEFPVAVKTHLAKTRKPVETAAVLASLDLLGACAGAFLASAVLIPILGFFNVCVLAGALNLSSGLYIWFKEK